MSGTHDEPHYDVAFGGVEVAAGGGARLRVFHSPLLKPAFRLGGTVESPGNVEWSLRCRSRPRTEARRGDEEDFFLASDPSWRIATRYRNNHGPTIIARARTSPMQTGFETEAHKGHEEKARSRESDS